MSNLSQPTKADWNRTHVYDAEGRIVTLAQWARMTPEARAACLPYGAMPARAYRYTSRELRPEGGFGLAAFALHQQWEEAILAGLLQPPPVGPGMTSGDTVLGERIGGAEWRVRLQGGNTTVAVGTFSVQVPGDVATALRLARDILDFGP